ncbi:MAG: C40 family peptidase [Bacteroidota bacterium]
MPRKFLYIFLVLSVASCGVVKKKTTYGKERKITVEASPEDLKKVNTDVPNRKTLSTKADIIINTALTFSGVRYKFGGTTKKGMDCSGLLFVSFREHDVLLPRTSYLMANEGKRIKVGKVTKGDLLFFKTSKKGKRINHVGLVVEVKGDDIKFIHSTSSRGVIVSSLREGFWNYAFVKATRVL